MKSISNLSRRGAPAGFATSLIASMACAVPAHAVVVAGMAEGTGLDVQVDALGLVGLGVGPAGTAQVNSPPGGADSGSVLSINQTVLLGSVVASNGTDAAITAAATSNVTGSAFTGQTQGSSLVNGLGITIIPGIPLVSPSFISITSDTLGSTSTSSGSFGSLASTGISVFENLSISIGGVAIAIPANPAPNTFLDLSVASLGTGVTIVLNEQIVTGDGINSTGITTNALRVSIDAVNVLGLSGVDGDIVIGQSESQLVAVPEPSTLVFLTALPAFAWLGRRRRS